MNAITRFLPILFAAAALPAAAADAWSHQYLSNEGLVLLARAGYGERFLAELIQAQPSRFDTSVEGLVFLAKNGVSEKMVKMILAVRRKADQEEEADGHAAPAHNAVPPATPSHRQQPAPVADPIRLKAVRQTVLVPESMAKATANSQIILLDPRYVQVR